MHKSPKAIKKKLAFGSSRGWLVWRILCRVLIMQSWKWWGIKFLPV